MPIGPAGPSPLAAPVVRAPRTLPSRAFAQLERLELKADERLEKAPLRLEVPLDAVSPALRRDELQGLSVRIGAPVGTATVVPLEVVEKNGRAFLSVAAEGLDLASLRMMPLVLQLGEPDGARAVGAGRRCPARAVAHGARRGEQRCACAPRGARAGRVIA